MASPASRANPASPNPASTAPASTAPATKAARQARIVAILSREQVHSQEQLAGLLAQYGGMHVTQATLSRDLDELGVVRLRATGGALVYALPGDPGGHGSPAGTSFEYSERRDLTPAPSMPPAAAPAPSPRSSAPPPRTSSASPRSPEASPAPSAASSPSPGASSRSSDALPLFPGASSPSSDALSPSSGAPVSPRLIRYLRELLTSAEASANLVVLRTPAGAAQFLASAIDHAAWPAILGTVAGDDTVLVIARDPAGGDALANEFRDLAERRR